LRLLLPALLLAASLAAQHRFERFAHHLQAIQAELRIPGMAEAVVDSGRPKEAIAQFQSILSHQPPRHHWSVSIARQQLGILQ
jgi:hypothetical protein